MDTPLSAAARPARAVEYRRLAQEAGDLAQASVLAEVRDKHQRAAATWTGLAEQIERAAERSPRGAAARVTGASEPATSGT